MLTNILLIVLILLVIWTMAIVSNGFTILSRKIDATDSKQMTVIKKADEVISRYNYMTKGIIEEVKGS